MLSRLSALAINRSITIPRILARVNLANVRVLEVLDGDDDARRRFTLRGGKSTDVLKMILSLACEVAEAERCPDEQ